MGGVDGQLVTNEWGRGGVSLRTGPAYGGSHSPPRGGPIPTQASASVPQGNKNSLASSERAAQKRRSTFAPALGHHPPPCTPSELAEAVGKCCLHLHHEKHHHRPHPPDSAGHAHSPGPLSPTSVVFIQLPPLRMDKQECPAAAQLPARLLTRLGQTPETQGPLSNDFHLPLAIVLSARCPLVSSLHCT